MSSSANIPGDADPDNFYDIAPLEPAQLYQGEILVDVPILNMPRPPRWLLLRTRSGRRVDEALNYGASGGTVNVLDSNQSAAGWYADCRGDFAMAVLDKRPALVFSQTCDIQSKTFIQIAPIFPAEEDASTLERLRRASIFSAFWIKAHPPEIPAESYADLELVQAVHKSYVKGIRPENHFRLSAERTRLLQQFVTRYFGRPNSYDAQSDRAPANGTYLCVRCFYMEGHATSISIERDAEFPICSVCRGTQWVIKGR